MQNNQGKRPPGRPKGVKNKVPRQPETHPRAKRLPGDPLYTGKSPFAGRPLKRGRKNTKWDRDQLRCMIITAFAWQETIFSRSLPEGRAGLARLLLSLKYAQELNAGKPARMKDWRYLYAPRDLNNATLRAVVNLKDVSKYLHRVKIGHYMLKPQGEAYTRHALAIIDLFIDAMTDAARQEPVKGCSPARFMAEAAEFARMYDVRNAKLIRQAIDKMGQ